jgi:hypothetical protein
MMASVKMVYCGEEDGNDRLLVVVLSKIKENLNEDVRKSRALSLVRATGIVRETGANLFLLTGHHDCGFPWFSSVPAPKCRDGSSDQTTNAWNILRGCQLLKKDSAPRSCLLQYGLVWKSRLPGNIVIKYW